MPGNLVADSKSGMWNVRWWVNKKEFRKSLGTRDRREAERQAKPILAEIKARRYGIAIVEAQPRGPTWEALLENYQRDETWPSKDSTRKRYLLDIRRVGDFLAEQGLRPAEASSQTVQEFVADCRGRKLGSSSIRNALTAWSRVIDSALHKGLLPSRDGRAPTNYVLEYSRKRIRNDAAAIHPPLNGEFERLLPEIETYNPDLALFADFLYRMGCRASEALLAERKDIFRDEAGDLRIWFRHGVKGDRARAPLLNTAEELLPRMPTRGRLFPNLDRRIAVVSSQWNRFWERRRTEEEAAAVSEGRAVNPDKLRRWRLHDHRHAFAIAALQEGAALQDLQGHLGHASVTTTELYLKARDRLPVSQRSSLRRVWKRGTRLPESEEDSLWYPKRRQMRTPRRVAWSEIDSEMARRWPPED